MCECESNPAEVYERYLGRAIADPFTRVLLECAGPKQGDRVLILLRARAARRVTLRRSWG